MLPLKEDKPLHKWERGQKPKAEGAADTTTGKQAKSQEVKFPQASDPGIQVPEILPMSEVPILASASSPAKWE